MGLALPSRGVAIVIVVRAVPPPTGEVFREPQARSTLGSCARCEMGSRPRALTSCAVLLPGLTVCCVLPIRLQSVEGEVSTGGADRRYQ